MVDLTHQLNQAQIAFGIAVIALAVVYYVFGRQQIKKSPSR